MKYPTKAFPLCSDCFDRMLCRIIETKAWYENREKEKEKYEILIALGIHIL